MPLNSSFHALLGLLLCFVSPGVFDKPGELVTCGSVLKLHNAHYKVHLHSHSLKYGTGSEQQSVTGSESEEDVNSHWVVKGGAKKPCFRGESVPCRGLVRLTHLETDLNLHSHHFPAPLSRGQEISAFKNDRDDDTGDHWAVECPGEVWRREDHVKLRHVNTGVYLAVSGSRFGRPIEGQYEVVGAQRPTEKASWRATHGLYIHPPEPVRTKFQVEHSEL